MSIAGAAIAICAFADAAAASPMYCGQRQAVLTMLASSHHEQPSSVALTSDGQLLEVLKSESDLSWTIIVTTPRGQSCVVAGGDNWQNRKIDRVVRDPEM